MKNILITGVARGLGKHLREYLLSKGYFVYGTSRNINNIPKDNNTKFFYLDLTDKASIKGLSDYFFQNNQTLDAIIHNAGVAFLDPIEILDENEYRHIFEVNFFGTVDLTKELLPILKKSPKSNLIFISSIVSVDCWPYLGAYAASKRALEAVAFEWAALLKSWNIHVSVIQPNPLPTDMQIMRSKNAPTSHYPELKDRDLKWECIQETVEVIAQILNDPSPQFQYQTGKHSLETVDSFQKKGAYQTSLKHYQEQFKELLNIK